MKKTNKKPVVLALNITAILFGIYAIITMYNSYTYISGLVDQGLVIKDEMMNIVNYYVVNSAPYIFYAIVIWSVGYIIGKINILSDNIIVTNEEVVNDNFEIAEELIEAEIIDEEIKEDDIEL